MRYALLIGVILASTTTLAMAAPKAGIYRSGDHRALSLSNATDSSFEFSLAIGAVEGENTCAEGDVSCLSISGLAKADGEGFTYVDPDGEGSITFELEAEDLIISKITGTLGSGSGNLQQLNWIAGVYELPPESSYFYFQTPSGNIGCAIWPGKDSYLRCDMKELRQTYKDPPSDCEFSWGSAFQLTATGKGEVICFNDTSLNASATKLEYGKTFELNGFHCVSEKTGLTCKNAAGHGFTLSKARQKVF